MKTENIRNVVILGHQSSGKTSLVESLAFTSKLIPVKGEVEKKNTLSDYTPEEQKRGGSVQTAVCRRRSYRRWNDRRGAGSIPDPG